MKKIIKFLIVQILIASVISSIFLGRYAQAQVEKRPFIYARRRPVYTEPIFSGWEWLAEPIRQVAETLFTYNLSDPNLAIQPLLATNMGIWDENETEILINLRQNVYFHDGTKFNASVVAWNLDRIKYFYENFEDFYTYHFELENITWVEIPGASLEYNNTQKIHIIKDYDIINEFTIKLILPYKYPMIHHHLCYQGFSMISPAAHPATSEVEEALVGTGPFVMRSLNSTGTTIFERFDDYWNVPADIVTMHWVYVPGYYTRTEGLIGGYGNRSYDFVKHVDWDNLSLIWKIYNDSSLVKKRIKRAVFDFIGFNTHQIPLNLRKAMAYAFDYDDYHTQRDVAPMYSPVTEGILYSKDDMNIPYFNLTKARQYMIYADALENDTLDEIDLGNLTITSSDQEWINRSLNDPILTYNLTYQQAYGWDYSYEKFASDMEYIGVIIEPAPMTGWDIYTRLYFPENWDKLRLFFTGWAADFPDPHNMISAVLEDLPILVNNSDVWDLIDIGLHTPDSEARRDIYYELQKIICEDMVPWVQLFSYEQIYIHTDELSGLEYNILSKNYFYPCKWDPYQQIPIINGYSVYFIIGFCALSVLSVIKCKKNKFN